jgi:transposase
MNNHQAVAMRAKREAIRLRAWELYENGWTQGEIAEVLGVVPSAVCKWVARGVDGGRDALLSRVAPGPVAKLTAEQKALIPSVLMRGAESFGYRGDLWTRARIGEVIEREFGVRYSESQVARLLKEWGWSLQRPKRRASQRNEEAITAWQEQHWPEVKKKR